MNIRNTPTPQQAIIECGITADSPLNYYSASKPLDPIARRYQGKRLDYIFFRHPSIPNHQRHHVIKAVQCNVTFTERLPGFNFSYSDHFGVEARFKLELQDPPLNGTESTVISRTPTPFEIDFSTSSFHDTLQALINYYRISRSNSRFQLLIFVICLAIIFGLIISSAFLPRSWINPIYIFFTVFVSWLATTMFYSGFIYGYWEINALTTIIEELELLKQRGVCNDVPQTRIE